MAALHEGSLCQLALATSYTIRYGMSERKILMEVELPVRVTEPGSRLLGSRLSDLEDRDRSERSERLVHFLGIAHHQDHHPLRVDMLAVDALHVLRVHLLDALEI